jgi:uncharacterized protein (TIGR02145 family)
MKINFLKLSLFLLFFSVLISCDKEDSISDIDGNSYKIIKIGNQTWMAENLRTTKFNDGEPIRNIIKNTDWKKTKEAAYSGYNNDGVAQKEYGYLYNYYCIENIKNIAPDGWRIPNENDIRILQEYLNSNAEKRINLKEKGNQHWMTSNKTGDKSSGFNVLPGGYRDEQGNFYMLKSNGYFWTENASVELYHWSDRMFQALADVRRDRTYEQFGFSIRCIKEE